MTSRSRYRLLGGRIRKGFLREVFCPLLFGIFIGLLLGKVYNRDQLEDFHQHSYVRQIPLEQYEYPDRSYFFLRCLVLVHPDAKKPLNFISAIRDTYGQQCNQTIFYTTNPEIQKRVRDQNVFLVQSNSNYFYWNFFTTALNHSSTVPGMWTVVLDEQVFLKVSNLKRALVNYNFKEKVILGRIIESRVYHIIPWMSNTRLSVQAGIVMSHSALRSLLLCNDYYLPRTTEKTILECAERQQITLVDPIDEERMHLFHYKDLKTLVPEAKDGEHACCSDHAVTFGQQSFKEIRMAHYASETWVVFGVNGVVEVNKTYAIDRDQLVRTTTVKPAPAAPAKKKGKAGLIQ